jgi:hypothetical protein
MYRFSYVDAWSIPLPKVLDTFNRSYQSGMESGDFEFGFLSLAAHNVYTFAAGLPLGPTLDDCEMMIGLSKQYHVKSVQGRR